MAKTNFRIDIDKISDDLKSVIPKFKMQDLKEISGASHATVNNWKKEVPDVVELIYYNSKVFNHSFFELIEKKSDNFPVFKLLKFYAEKTGKKIESVIIKD